MHTQVVKIESPAQTREIEETGRLLREGAVVAIPTETVYGLAANALDETAVRKIFEAKGRPQDNPLIVHIADLDAWPPLVQTIPPEAYALAAAYWPGPLTIILPKADCIPDAVSCGLPTVAVRMPSHPIAAALIRAAGVPLAAPSANTSGKPSPTTAEHVLHDLDGRIDRIVDGGQCIVGVESTVVTLAAEKPRLLRPGGITLRQLEDVLGEVDVDRAVLGKAAAGEKAASPGMKYKHYSPAGDVKLVKGSAAQFAAYAAAFPPQETAVVCFDGEQARFDRPVFTIGDRHDGEAHAHAIFDVLRRTETEGYKTVLIHCPGDEGVDLAVLNRLLRAAEFELIELPHTTVIGLTGPTGAGKSTIASLLAEKGFLILDGDRIARDVMQPGSPLLHTLAEAFGEDVLLPDGALDRRLLAQRAFASEENTALLNALTHPEIERRMFETIDAHPEAPAAVLDAAALIESGICKRCDLLAVVLAPPEVRLERILARDGISRKEAETRMRAQHPDSFYTDKADVVLLNDGLHAPQDEILKIIERLPS